jgi:hypothetical protein
MTCSIETLNIMTLSIKALSIRIKNGSPGIMILSIMTFGIATLIRMTLSQVKLGNDKPERQNPRAKYKFPVLFNNQTPFQGFCKCL